MLVIMYVLKEISYNKKGRLNFSALSAYQ